RTHLAGHAAQTRTQTVQTRVVRVRVRAVRPRACAVRARAGSGGGRGPGQLGPSSSVLSSAEGLGSGLDLLYVRRPPRRIAQIVVITTAAAIDCLAQDVRMPRVLRRLGDDTGEQMPERRVASLFAPPLDVRGGIEAQRADRRVRILRGRLVQAQDVVA